MPFHGFDEPVLSRPKNLSFEFIRNVRKPEQEEPEMKKQQRKRQPQRQSRSSGERAAERHMEQTGKMITTGAGLLFTGAALGAMFGMLPEK